MNVGRGDALESGGDNDDDDDDEGGDAVQVFCAGSADVKVAPHLVLPPLTGNEISAATGFGVWGSSVVALEISSPILSLTSCSCTSFLFFLCCSTSKATHSSFARFFSATSMADKPDVIGVHSFSPSWSLNLSGLASRRFCAEFVD